VNWSGLVRAACIVATLCSFALPQAEALEIVGGASLVARPDDGMISKVVIVRRGGVYRGPRGGVYRGGTVYRGGSINLCAEVLGETN
jgi:hypothetical protein